MTDNEFAQLVTSRLKYTPNSQQQQVIAALARFCSPAAADESVFLLNGYAGTGKTSICGALVGALKDAGAHAVLLAPTGRAAKVFAAYSGHLATTIHKEIYAYMDGALAANTGRASARENKRHNTFFIVDEASMITGDEGGGDSVLADLIHYVYTGDRCRLILLGDTAQLPPVGCESSPAMDPDVLRSYGLKVTRVTLTEIARQGRLSGILASATWLRKAMRQTPLPAPKVLTGYADVREIEGEDMPEELYNAYSGEGVEDTIVVTRSNRRAVGFNREIRASVLYLEEVLAKGEMVIVSKNNYYWTEKIKSINFIANGDILQVVQVLGTEDKYGFAWADVILMQPDTETEFQAKVMLMTLNMEQAHLPQESYNSLYYSIMEDPELFSPYTPADVRLRALRTNPYWNALQLKYAYAVTCHKAQGGQWSNVFVDMGYIPEDAMGMDFYRWLYTAVTRARKRLWILR